MWKSGPRCPGLLRAKGASVSRRARPVSFISRVWLLPCCMFDPLLEPFDCEPLVGVATAPYPPVFVAICIHGQSDRGVVLKLDLQNVLAVIILAKADNGRCSCGSHAHFSFACVFPASGRRGFRTVNPR